MEAPNWFHPHHGLQLERGLYAPFVIEDPDDEPVDGEYVVVLDDWLDGAGTTPELELERIPQSGAAMGSTMDHSAMGGMARSPLLGGDAGDARHPFHLINGRPRGDVLTLDPQPRSGDRIRLRIVNAGADTAYRLAVGGHRLTVTHSDGFAVEPVTVDALLIGMGERYDVTFTAMSGAWPVVALAEGKDQRAVAVLRTRDAIATATPDLTRGPGELEGKWLRYADLHAAARAVLSPPATIRRIPVRLTGGMSAYDWGSMGGATATTRRSPSRRVSGYRSTSPTPRRCGTRSTSTVTHRNSGRRVAVPGRTRSTSCRRAR